MANKYTAMKVPPKSDLEHLYHVKMMSQHEVGEHYGTTQKVVFSWFKKLNIHSRIAAKRNQKGSKNSSWKANEATYAAFHYRVVSERGRPNICMACGTQDASIYEWCNLTGRYDDISDYMRMCRKCHRKYDKNRKNSSKHVRRTAK